jgi:hypothetical protein
MKKYCFFIYTKSDFSEICKSYKVEVCTDKGLAAARAKAIHSFKGNNISKIEFVSVHHNTNKD